MKVFLITVFLVFYSLLVLYISIKCGFYVSMAVSMMPLMQLIIFGDEKKV